MSNKKKGIILLSGGLDSLVCAGGYKDTYNIKLALFFDYGQTSLNFELQAVKKICKFYGFELKKISLPWLKEVSISSALTRKGIDIINSEDNVWIPNRNGVFVNIAGSVAEGLGYSHILIGANVQEATEFPDNSKEFIESVNSEFFYSIKFPVKVIAPLVNYDKNEIVKLALEQRIPLEFVRSCYSSTKTHCGICKSCIGLKNALEYNGDTYYTKLLFGRC